MAAEETTKNLSLPEALRELVKMRVSQINGCAFCLDLHAPAARQAGVSQQKLDVLAAWRESPAFDDRERAALAGAHASRDAGNPHRISGPVSRVDST
ncbi:carboxymuconolactone decarboxylase family protein [Rhodovulum sulfidophilum]|nr:carboxymuconolactone decarboxylase family protein [Rhodovulum sulfidophilum]MCE8433581.1 carboxymuconolactone decarboxylase family protein [Rhodovulum sulfidophilum]MCF4117757.1 carboxymuconolactone decarboxylase family protein [Rhodovulum sulfidophilum]